jgi:hypothetical protein
MKQQLGVSPRDDVLVEDAMKYHSKVEDARNRLASFDTQSGPHTQDDTHGGLAPHTMSSRASAEALLQSALARRALHMSEVERNASNDEVVNRAARGY